MAADFPQLKCRFIGGPHNGETYKGHVCSEFIWWDSDGKHLYRRTQRQKNFRFVKTMPSDWKCI